MRAAVFHGRGDVRIEEVADPTPQGSEVVLRVAAAGICGTDGHEFAHGPVMFPIHQPHSVTGHSGPMIPGHELAGIVVARGSDVIGLAEGTLVASGAGISCGSCHWCLRQRTNLCERYSTVGLQRNGALAGYVALPASTCIAADPYGLKPDAAALGQPMSIAVHAMRRGRPEPGDVAVVLGAGGIGAFLVYALSQHQVTTVVSDPSTDRLKIAQALGADVCLPSVDAEQIQASLRDRDLIPSVIYEVSGTAGGLQTAMHLAPRGCRITLIGLQANPGDVPFRDLALREIEIIGTNAHVVGTDLPEALRLLSSRTDGWGDVAPVALSLDRLLPDGLEPLAAGTSPRIKTLIDPWAASTRPTQTI